MPESASPTENINQSMANVQPQQEGIKPQSYQQRLDSSLRTYAGTSSRPNTGSRSSSRERPSLSPTSQESATSSPEGMATSSSHAKHQAQLLVSGLKDPARSYENLMSDSPPILQGNNRGNEASPGVRSSATSLSAALYMSPTRAEKADHNPKVHTPAPTSTSTAASLGAAHPWSLLKRRQLNQMLSISGLTPPGPGGFSPNLAAVSPDVHSGSAYGSSYSGSGFGSLRVSAIVRPLSLSEVAAGRRRVLSVENDGRTLLIARPDVFKGAHVEHVAAAAAAYGQGSWAQRYRFHRCFWAPSAGMQNASSTAEDDDDVASSRMHMHAPMHSPSSSGAGLPVICAELVDTVLSGFSAACMVYGGPDSGRSSVLLGSAGAGAGASASAPGRSASNRPDRNAFRDNDNENDMDKDIYIDVDGEGRDDVDIDIDSDASTGTGIAQRVFSRVVEELLESDDSYADTAMHLTCLEICETNNTNDKLVDLLVGSYGDQGMTTPTEIDNARDNGPHLRLREHPVNGPYVAGLHRVKVHSAADVTAALRTGAHNFRKGSSPVSAGTPASACSRGHFVATLELTHKKSSRETDRARERAAAAGADGEAESEDPTQRTIKLHMVLLAYPPLDSASPAPAPAVRRSLHTLGLVVKAMGRSDVPKMLPFRDSALTWLLRDALSGQGLVSVIATLSPADRAYEQSVATAKLISQWMPAEPQGVSQDGATLASGAGTSSAGASAAVRRLVAAEAGRGSGLGAVGGGGPTAGNAISYESAIHRLHEGLGAHSGTLAARTLLQATVSDPQQKASRAGNGSSAVFTPNTRAGPSSSAAKSTSKISAAPAAALTAKKSSALPPPPQKLPSPRSNASSPGTHIAMGDVGGLEPLRENYRSLQAVLVEMQLELDSVRTDRDMLRVDLDTARAGLTSISSSPRERERLKQRAVAKSREEIDASRAAAAEQLEAAHRELRALRAILSRKEESLEQLSDDLRAERECRAQVESTTEATIRECLQRFGEMQSRISVLEDAEASSALQASEAKATLRVLQAASTGQEATAQQALEASKESVVRLEAELATEKERSASCAAEAHAARAALSDANADLRATRDIVSELRASLVASAESARSETELGKALLHRVSSAETAAAVLRVQNESLQREAAAELSRLHKSVHDLLLSSGSSMQARTADTRQLMEVVAGLRAGMASLAQPQSQNAAAQAALAEERAARAEEAKNVKEMLARQMTALQESTAKATYWQTLAEKQREYITKMELAYAETSSASGSLQLRSAEQVELRAAQDRARTWQKTAEDSQAAQAQLQLQLQALQASRSSGADSAEIAAQKQQAAAAQTAMQEEYASLWVAVQDLNRLDAQKEQAIHALVKEQERSHRKLQHAQAAYQAMQAELRSIDDELLQAAREEGLGDVAGRILRVRESFLNKSPTSASQNSPRRSPVPVPVPVLISAPASTSTAPGSAFPRADQRVIRSNQFDVFSQSQSQASATAGSVVGVASHSHSRSGAGGAAYAPPRSPRSHSRSHSHSHSRSRSRSPLNSQGEREPLSTGARRGGDSSQGGHVVLMKAEAEREEENERDLCRSLDDINMLLERGARRSPPPPPPLPGSIRKAR
jgi:hypothetical protein